MKSALELPTVFKVLNLLKDSAGAPPPSVFFNGFSNAWRIFSSELNFSALTKSQCFSLPNLAYIVKLERPPRNTTVKMTTFRGLR